MNNQTEELIKQLNPNMIRCKDCGNWINKDKLTKEEKSYINNSKWCNMCINCVLTQLNNLLRN